MEKSTMSIEKSNRKILGAGLIGTAVVALCCFTPVPRHRRAIGGRRLARLCADARADLLHWIDDLRSLASSTTHEALLTRCSRY